MRGGAKISTICETSDSQSVVWIAGGGSTVTEGLAQRIRMSSRQCALSVV